MKQWNILSAAALGLFLMGDAFAEDKPPAKVESPEAWIELQKGEPVLLIREDETAGGKVKRTRAGLLIDAPPEIVWDVVCNKEAAPAYVENLKRAEIVEKGARRGRDRIPHGRTGDENEHPRDLCLHL